MTQVTKQFGDPAKWRNLPSLGGLPKRLLFSDGGFEPGAIRESDPVWPKRGGIANQLPCLGIVIGPCSARPW